MGWVCVVGSGALRVFRGRSSQRPGARVCSELALSFIGGLGGRVGGILEALAIVAVSQAPKVQVSVVAQHSALSQGAEAAPCTSVLVLGSPFELPHMVLTLTCTCLLAKHGDQQAVLPRYLPFPLPLIQQMSELAAEMGLSTGALARMKLVAGSKR